jgi:hypothetical protein
MNDSAKSETEKALVHFITTYREPIPIRDAARDLANLGRYGAQWPRASIKTWERRLNDLVRDGLLERNGILLSAPPLAIETESLPASGPQEEPTPLFDYINQRETTIMK